MEIIAKVVDLNSTQAEALNQIEVWGTDMINVQAHVIVATAMKEFCERVQPRQNENFEIRALRQTDNVEAGHVRFGVALLARDDVFSAQELEELKRGVAQLARRIGQARPTVGPDLIDGDIAPIFPAEQAEVLKELERHHGGRRLDGALEMRIEDHARIQVKTQILQHADVAAEELPRDFIGRVDRCDFERFQLSVSLNPATGIKGTRSIRAKLGCTDLDLFTLCINAGLARTALRFQVREVEEDDGRKTIELEGAMHVADGDAGPLVP